jgi:hypothetical protein
MIISVQMKPMDVSASTSSLDRPLDEQAHQRQPAPRVFKPTIITHWRGDSSPSNVNNSEQNMYSGLDLPSPLLCHQQPILAPSVPLPGREQQQIQDVSPNCVRNSVLGCH